MSEEWRPIAGFDGYQVSSEGNVRGPRGGILKPYPAQYLQVTIYRCGKKHLRTIHGLVCEAFHGRRPSAGHEAAHGDGNSHNNREENLRWATRAENEADKILHGTSRVGKPSPIPIERRASGSSHGRHTKPEATARGERSGLAKLTEEKVIAIRRDPRARKQIAKDLGISVTMVGFIQRGICWAHVPMPEHQGAE